MMASILRAAGLSDGACTPRPFLIRFNERMQVDGRQITDDELCENHRPMSALWRMR